MKGDTRSLDYSSFGDDIAWRRLLTVRGRSGAALLLHPLQDESALQIAEALSSNFSAKQLASIVHVATDSPSGKLYGELRFVRH